MTAAHRCKLEILQLNFWEYNLLSRKKIMTQDEEDSIEMNRLMTRRGWEEEPKSRMSWYRIAATELAVKMHSEASHTIISCSEKGKVAFFCTDMRWIGPWSKQHHESCSEVPLLVAIATTNRRPLDNRDFVVLARLVLFRLISVSVADLFRGKLSWW